MGWPGLAREVMQISKAVGVEDVNVKEVGKEELEEAVFFANQKELKEDMEKYEKLKDVKNQDFRKEQDYMNEKGLARGRMAFRIRTRMVKKVKRNFRNMYRDNLICENCDMMEEETQEHVMECPAWREELGELDMNRMEDQVEFYIRVMKKKVK